MENQNYYDVIIVNLNKKLVELGSLYREALIQIKDLRLELAKKNDDKKESK